MSQQMVKLVEGALEQVFPGEPAGGSGGGGQPPGDPPAQATPQRRGAQHSQALPQESGDGDSGGHSGGRATSSAAGLTLAGEPPGEGSRKLPKPADPPKWRGVPGEDRVRFEHWAQEIMNWTVGYPKATSYELAKSVGAFLEGPARTVWLSLCTEEGDALTFQLVMERLAERSGSVMEAQDALAELKRFKQLPDETVAGYEARFGFLFLKEGLRGQPEKFKITAFRSGLHLELQKELVHMEVESVRSWQSQLAGWSARCASWRHPSSRASPRGAGGSSLRA